MLTFDSAGKMSGILAAMLLLACNSGEKQEQEEEIFIAKETTIHCYSRVSGKDTAVLTINLTGNLVTGDLTYYFSEKDRNTGTIKGEMSGDTLKAEYTFQSEGKESVREIRFLKKEVDLIPGYADMEEKKGKQIFKKDAIINYTDTVLFKNIPCPDQK